MPSGSKTRSSQLFSINLGIISKLGLSLISSVLGLKVKPKIANTLVEVLFGIASKIFLCIVFFLFLLLSTTCSISFNGDLKSCAVFTKASVSFGKQDPP